MPGNNRVHSSAALQTHGIWQSAIGYDPYAPEKSKHQPPSSSSSVSSNAAAPSSVPSASAAASSDNAYTSYQDILVLIRVTGSNSDETRGACKKCGRVGLDMDDDVEAGIRGAASQAKLETSWRRRVMLMRARLMKTRKTTMIPPMLTLAGA
ncbi:hypothetical protein E2562_034258 [Oryza meyeriana var. granulata]|uniref:Uncharacterized protein n=1 Tax=Oryza meyeriana var. granulata TaxID=110450 RepID=A0A6G1ESH8_9ORYZ|nr:hypothetical protein E2562_034258 [Oryza meyeriana var. granulata]